MPHDGRDARSAQFISLFNGVMAIAAAGARAGWLNAGDIELLHESMTKPLDQPEHAGHRGLEEYRCLIDDLLLSIRAQTSHKGE